MSNGDDESEVDAEEEGSEGATDQASAEKAGAAESELGSDEENPTAKEIAADEDTGSDAEDEPAGEADEEARLEADQMEAERADEESTSGDDAEVDAPDEAAEERDETEGESADEETEGDQEDEETADDVADETATEDENETDETPEEEVGGEGANESAAEDEETSEDTEEADATEEESPADEEPKTDESDAEGDENDESEGTETDDETDEGGKSDEDGAADEEGEDTEPDEGGEAGKDSEADEGDGDDEDAETDAIETKHTPESLDDRLDDIEARINEAETEADLDAVEDDLDDVEADVEAADLPEPDEEDADEGDEGEEGQRTRDEIESRVTELREAIEAQRGPYAEDIVEQIEGVKTTITETRWTDQGERETADAVERFLDEAGDVLDEEFAVEHSDDSDADGENEVATDGGEDQANGDENAVDEDDADEHGPLIAALDDAIETIEARDLDPDEDEETIADLVEAAEELTNDLDDAEEWDDLTVREKLTVEGFYDVLSAENRKDFPPEWNAIKIYEKQNEPVPILRGLEMFGSDFMEEHCMESLKRLGAPAAFDAMEQRAQKRDKLPIAALGKIGDDRALETLHEYIEGESDPGLQKVTLKALGEIGSQDSTQPVADRLVADNETCARTRRGRSD